MKTFASRRIILALTNPKTRSELIKITKLPERTLRYNLAVLKKKNRIKETLVLTDMRSKLFELISSSDGDG